MRTPIDFAPIFEKREQMKERNAIRYIIFQHCFSWVVLAIAMVAVFSK